MRAPRGVEMRTCGDEAEVLEHERGAIDRREEEHRADAVDALAARVELKERRHAVTQAEEDQRV